MPLSPHTKACLRAFYEGVWEGLAAPYYLAVGMPDHSKQHARPQIKLAPPDYAVLARDWQRIGLDLHKVISDYEATLQQKTGSAAPVNPAATKRDKPA
ncbi:hypothetical protein [Duganella qianjiadongensis]|uniref:Uncharacterized protein n=1 Tax=Duganella qianjiadongensis TaxID=2692176 RepID=A0ABW9VRV8_9BURK|nr:hypothetical protein [Duganella qianjiadongensis]MYM40607.1 hypothetical protein [Duganella qianjiadongensis]